MKDSSQYGHGTEEAGALFSLEHALIAGGRLFLVVGNTEEAGAPLACESINEFPAYQMGLGGRARLFSLRYSPFFSLLYNA